MEYSSIEACLAAIQSAVNESMVNEVATVAKETMIEEIQETVYDSYNPVVYQRRGIDGGLADIDNINSKLISNGVIAITNDTPVNPNYGGSNAMSLTEQIITGQGYDFTGDGTGAYLQPRDFMEATEQKIISENLHTTALVSGLKKRGFEVT